MQPQLELRPRSQLWLNLASKILASNQAHHSQPETADWRRAHVNLQ
jgi:hypothetical protein